MRLPGYCAKCAAPIPKKRKFCDGCRPPSKPCVGCGVVFTRPPNYPLPVWHKRKYCSHACWKEFRAKADNAIARFHTKYTRCGPDECWEWQFGRDSAGYGLFASGSIGLGSLAKAHRVAFLLHNGYVPAPGRVVMHTCDNRKCVNPAHLIEGTVLDNNQDMDSKGRRAPALRGEANPRAFISDEIAADIKARVRANPKTRISDIAREYGFPYHAVWNLCRGRTWRHL